MSSTGSSTDQLDAGFTNVPRPCSTRTTPLAASAFTASRTVSRLTPASSASSVSLGRAEFVEYRPPRMSLTMSSARPSASAGRLAMEVPFDVAGVGRLRVRSRIGRHRPRPRCWRQMFSATAATMIVPLNTCCQ
jgi:hypothetical protein